MMVFSLPADVRYSWSVVVNVIRVRQLYPVFPAAIDLLLSMKLSQYRDKNIQGPLHGILMLHVIF